MFTLVLSGSFGDEQAYAVLCHNGPAATQFEHIDLLPDEDKWKFSKTDHPIAQLIFIDSQRNIVEKPSTGQKLYIAGVDAVSRIYPLQIINDELVFTDTMPGDRTVYLKIPDGMNFRYNDIRGRNWIYIGNVTLTSLLDIDLKGIRISLSPVSNDVIDPNDTSVIIGNTCIGDCAGKSCTQDNGCGEVCGCPKGESCNTITGKCEANSTPCKGNTECGTENGRCPGKCGIGKECKRDINGYFKCMVSDLSTEAIAFLIGVFIIIILLIIVTILAVKR